MKLSRPDAFFLAVALVVGVFSALLTPYGAGTDEETHMARIWEMSLGEWVPNRLLQQSPAYPTIFLEHSYRQDKNLLPVSVRSWVDQFLAQVDPNDVIAYKTRSIYFPTLYIIQAVLLWGARQANLPLGVMYYLLRFASLGMYVGLTYLAIRLIPVGKWLLAVLALAPTAIFHAGFVSVEGLHYGISFLFIAWVFSLLQISERPLAWREWAITLAIVALVCTLKLNHLVLLLLLGLLPPALFPGRRQKAGLIVAVVLLVVVLGLGWNILVVQDLPFENINPADQVRFILQNPMAFLRTFAANLLTEGGRYLNEWIAMLGHNYWELPGLVYVLYLSGLLIAVLQEGGGALLTKRRRTIFLAVFAAYGIAIIGLLYLNANPVGSAVIAGVQGRYFIGGAPLFFLAVLPSRSLISISARWLAGSMTLLWVLALVAVALVYHLFCGSAYWMPGLCYLPAYKNWAPHRSSSLTLQVDQPVQQTFQAFCNDMTQVRLWLGETGRETLQVTLADLESQAVVAEETFAASEYPVSPWLVASFPPISNSKLKQYVFTISTTGPRSILIPYIPTDEYLSGQASQSGENLIGDLPFHYACRVGLSKVFSPLSP